ncbi:hypothetical protein NL676_000036 [Syzygium grande]|nr:hypothetical protein NL676_000036 [Syzygium grande]
MSRARWGPGRDTPAVSPAAAPASAPCPPFFPRSNCSSFAVVSRYASAGVAAVPSFCRLCRSSLAAPCSTLL